MRAPNGEGNDLVDGALRQRAHDAVDVVHRLEAEVLVNESIHLFMGHAHRARRSYELGRPRRQGVVADGRRLAQPPIGVTNVATPNGATGSSNSLMSTFAPKNPTSLSVSEPVFSQL